MAGGCDEGRFGREEGEGGVGGKEEDRKGNRRGRGGGIALREEAHVHLALDVEYFFTYMCVAIGLVANVAVDAVRHVRPALGSVKMLKPVVRATKL